MATFNPRPTYTEQELQRLYPKALELKQVQVLLRHGERTPVSARFRNTGLSPYWPYCNAAKRFRAVTMTSDNADSWTELGFKRRLETFGAEDLPVLAAGPSGEVDAICAPGELTDKGRQTTLALGQRLRHIYITQLQFLATTLSNPEVLRLRSTPIPRALESLQQAFTGLYPPSARAADCSTPTIITRAQGEETLYPNTSACRRFAQLTQAFAKRAARRWNNSPEMEYLNTRFEKWMPPSSPRVQVDSHPSLVGIMDTINATDSHGPATKLPKEFYDEKARRIIDAISVEEWYAGYEDSAEYRRLGVGSLAADIVTQMMQHVQASTPTNAAAAPPPAQPKLTLSGCHDTTLAALLTSLGAFAGEPWPCFTSHIAIELFRRRGPASPTALSPPLPPPPPPHQHALSSSASVASHGPAAADIADPSARPPQPAQDHVVVATPTGWLGFISSLFARAEPSPPAAPSPRTPYAQLPSSTQSALSHSYFVRVRYNDRVMLLPGCKPEGRHFEADETLCTLEAFKRVVDGFTPRDWRVECLAVREGGDQVPAVVEPAGAFADDE